MNLEEYIQLEVDRKKSKRFIDFGIAIHYAKIGPDFKLSELLGTPMVEVFKSFVMTIAELVEPELNDMTMESALKGEGNLRKVVVGLIDREKAASPADVPHQFHRWAVLWTEGILRPGIQPTKKEVDEMLKKLLEIHPWVDGNTRTASILMNWMLGTLDNPTQLPYYFKE